MYSPSNNPQLRGCQKAPSARSRTGVTGCACTRKPGMARRNSVRARGM